MGSDFFVNPLNFDIFFRSGFFGVPIDFFILDMFGWDYAPLRRC